MDTHLKLSYKSFCTPDERNGRQSNPGSLGIEPINLSVTDPKFLCYLPCPKTRLYFLATDKLCCLNCMIMSNTTT